MADRSFDNVQAPESEVKIVTGGFTTNSTSNPDAPVGCVSSVARGDVGQHTVTLKEKYCSLLHHDLQVIGTAGTQMFLESANVAAGTLQVQIRSVPTGESACRS